MLIKTFLGLAEMMFGPVYARCSLHKMASFKNEFLSFAPCQMYQKRNINGFAIEFK